MAADFQRAVLNTWNFGIDVAQEVHNESLKIYGASYLSWAVPRVYTAMGATPLHAAAFTATALLVSTVVKTISQRLVADSDIRPQVRKLIIAAHSLALASLITKKLELRITLIQGILLAVASTLIATSALKPLEQKPARKE